MSRTVTRTGTNRVVLRDDTGDPLIIDLSSQPREQQSLNDWITRFSPTVRAVILRYIPSYLGSPEDLEQEIWAQFIRGHGGKNYLHIYDPNYASPKTFMWEFARRRCMQFLSRSDRTPTARALSIQSQPGEEFVVGIVDPETNSGFNRWHGDQLSHNEYEAIEFTDLVKQAEKAIHSQRQRGRRDLPWVWYLLRRGFRQDQIAAEMGLSEGTISICMTKIREIPEVEELRAWAVERGLLSDGANIL